MTPRGPKPLPTSVKKLRGTLRPHRAIAGEPKVSTSVPTPPEWLSPDARREWDRITPKLVAAGLVSQLDLGVLVGYVTAWGDLCEATRVVQEQGTTFISPRGMLVLHPLLKTIERSRQSLRAFASEFGLSPSARSRVGANAPPDDDDEARRRKFFPALARGGRP
jgi:P27 family predicted phage terminase small subunit